MSHPQKGHGKKRPRRFHRGRAEGRRAVPAIDAVERAEVRAATVDAEVHAEQRRHRDDVQVWRQQRHAAPFVPLLEVTL